MDAEEGAADVRRPRQCQAGREPEVARRLANPPTHGQRSATATTTTMTGGAIRRDRLRTNHPSHPTVAVELGEQEARDQRAGQCVEHRSASTALCSPGAPMWYAEIEIASTARSPSSAAIRAGARLVAMGMSISQHRAQRHQDRSYSHVEFYARI